MPKDIMMDGAKGLMATLSVIGTNHVNASNNVHNRFTRATNMCRYDWTCVPNITIATGNTIAVMSR